MKRLELGSWLLAVPLLCICSGPVASFSFGGLWGTKALPQKRELKLSAQTFSLNSLYDDDVMRKYEEAMAHQSVGVTEPAGYQETADPAITNAIVEEILFSDPVEEPVEYMPQAHQTLPPTRLRNFALNAIAQESTLSEWKSSFHASLQDQEISRALEVVRDELGDDRLEVDVGGETFLTSRATLMAHSSYFKSRLSDVWGTGHTENTIFLDQDPDAFRVLLSYMRSGYIEHRALSAQVLALADLLGMSTLLRAVKCVAFRYLNPSEVNTNDDEVCRRFDLSFGGVIGAVRKGVLPEAIQPISPERAATQTAQLLVYDGWVSNFQRSDLSLYVEVKVTANVLAEEGIYHPQAEGYDTLIVPDCHTIHDALNWLHDRGFEFMEDEYQTINFPNDHRAWENLWFTRPLTSNRVDDPSNIILFDHTRYPRAERKRKKLASLLVSRDQMDAFMYADRGRKTRMGFPGASNGALPAHVPQQLMNEGFDSKISLDSSRNAWAMVGWLAEHGYTEVDRGSRLRQLLLEMQYRAFSHQEENAHPGHRPSVNQDEVDFRLFTLDISPDTRMSASRHAAPFA